MSTKQSIKYEHDVDQGGFHLYEECLDSDRQFVYLAFTGVEFTANTSGGKARVEVAIPRARAEKLGLVQPISPTETPDAT